MTVIKELNYQKNYGSDSLRKQAGLCLSKLIVNNTIIKNKYYSEFGRTNNSKISNPVEPIDKKNNDKMVYLLTNDRDFKLLVGVVNLKTVNLRELFSELPQKIYNKDKTQEFYESVMNAELRNAEQLLNQNVDVSFVMGKQDILH